MFNRFIYKSLQNTLSNAVMMLISRHQQIDDESNINSFGVGAMMPQDMPETKTRIQNEVLGV